MYVFWPVVAGSVGREGPGEGPGGGGGGGGGGVDHTTPRISSFLY